MRALHGERMGLPGEGHARLASLGQVFKHARRRGHPARTLLVLPRSRTRAMPPSIKISAWAALIVASDRKTPVHAARRGEAKRL